MKKNSLILFFGLFCVFSTHLIAQNYSQNLTDHFENLLEKNELLSDDAQWLITDEHISRTSDIQHVYFKQHVNEIEVFGTQSSIHILNGETLSSNNKFIFKSTDKVFGVSSPSINAIQATTAAANQLDYIITNAITVLETSQGSSQKTILSNGGISLSDIPAKLVYHVTDTNKLVLAWDISIQEITQKNWWSMRVDAFSGTILNKINWMSSCNFEHDHAAHEILDYNKNLYDIPNYSVISEDISGCNTCYEVFAMPLESPYFGSRTIENGIEDASASPYGWHDTDGAAGAEFTVTRGNNVDAYEDGNNSGYQPDGGPSLDFTGYPFDEIYSGANQYEAASITNLFYWNNIIHDVFYQYGFDEVSGNFQENNYGNGGAGSDYVYAEGQDGSGTCNANFGTPTDGGNPTMQMYICGNKDGDFDHAVVCHEYGHGIDRRLVAGPNNVNCNGNTENMGEGIGDWFGLMLTMESGDAGTDVRGVGTYLLNEGANGPGIRNYPYSTDLAVNPQTYGSLPGTGGQTHNVGEIWGVMLWEVSWALIDENGFDANIYNYTGDVNLDAGNIMAMALIVEGLKLQPCNSGFVDARDAIFAADLAIYGGANECILWEAFAKRGLGFSADQGSSDSHTDGTEAFDSPVPAIDTEEEVCVGQGTQVYGGGTPIGGEYSGPGVTDNGDGLTYTFDPAVAGIGIHSIGYDVTSLCATGTAFDDIEVITDVPEIVCQDVALELDENGEAVLTFQDVVVNVLPGDMAVDQTGTFAPIDISGTGTEVPLGDDNGSAALAIGFDFGFYGNNYTNFYIASNGFVSFSGNGMTGAISRNPTTLPSADEPNDIIALMWEDLDPGSGGTIRYETIGTAPDRMLIVDFDEVPYWNTSVVITTQLQLFETSNRIEIHSTSVPGDDNATQGIENFDGTEGIATPGRNYQVWSATDDYVAFYYLPGNTADNCGAVTTVTLGQELFTCDDLGTNSITITIDDGNGNTNTCTTDITVTDPLDLCELSTESYDMNQNISLHPNPTLGDLVLTNNSSVELVSMSIYDIDGRVVKNIDLPNSSTSTLFSVQNLATGVYFVKIQSQNTNIIKRIIKR